MIWLILFIMVPLLDLTLLVHLAHLIGFGWTVLTVVVTGMIGSYLVRRQGMAVLRGIRTDLAEGRVPTDRIVSGVLLLVGGVLLITPGVMTDCAGLLLMVPGNRRLLSTILVRHVKARMDQGANQVFFFHTPPHAPQDFHGPDDPYLP